MKALWDRKIIQSSAILSLTRMLPSQSTLPREILRDQIKSALLVLTPREREVLELRFGLSDGRDYTLEEVGKHFNVTRERIRQIEAKALRKLRHPTRSRHLRDYSVKKAFTTENTEGTEKNFSFY